MVSLGLKIAAFVLFVLAAVPPVPYHGSLVAAGLGCYTLADIVGHG